MADTDQYDFATLFLLEPVRQPTPPLPTRWWSWRGTLQMDVGDGNGTQSWLGSSFGDTEVMGVSSIEATADGIPARMGIRVGVDETRDDIRHAITGRDLGPVATTLFFGYREAGTEDWSLLTDGTEARVIKGRSAASTIKNGVWAFDVENRVHDADRLIVDIWSDAVQQSKHPGDLFFSFTASIEEGLDFDWPN